MLRYLQLMASASCILVCVVLFALAKSSYSQAYLVDWHSRYAKLQIISASGRLKITRIEPSYGPYGGNVTNVREFQIPSEGTAIVMRYVSGFGNRRGFGFQRVGPMMVAVPYWYLILVLAILAAVLAFKRTCRFGLRSILAGMAVVAILLGIIVAP